jgi:hypothetical protein
LAYRPRACYGFGLEVLIASAWLLGGSDLQ